MAPVEPSRPDLYREAIERFVNNKVPRDPRRIAVTEIAGCLRRAYYNRTMPGERLGPDAIRITVGIGFHELLARILSEHLDGLRVENEVRVEFLAGDDTLIVGRVDLIVEDTPVEVKTTGRIPDEPYPEHARQLRYYLAMLGAPKGTLLYVSRDGELRTYTVTLGSRKETILEATYRARQLRKALETNTPPPSEPGPHCNTCPYKWICQPWNHK